MSEFFIFISVCCIHFICYAHKSTYVPSWIQKWKAEVWQCNCCRNMGAVLQACVQEVAVFTWCPWPCAGAWPLGLQHASRSVHACVEGVWCICEFLMEGRYSFFLTLITDWSMLAYFENNAEQVTFFSLFFLWCLLYSESVESFYSFFFLLSF